MIHSWGIGRSANSQPNPRLARLIEECRFDALEANYLWGSADNVVFACFGSWNKLRLNAETELQ
jgi:hypothetical protein